ncbi:hypothetical protein ACFQX7_17010 [Luedemannella flava]
MYVGTLRGSGQTLLPPVFSSGIGVGGTSVGACARASWQTTTTGFLGFGISFCMYSWASANGGFATTPEIAKMDVFDTSGQFDYGSSNPPPPSGDHREDCADGPPTGWNEPPDFAWFASNSRCLTTLVGGSADTGPRWSPACTNLLHDAWLGHDRIRLPVYDGMKGTGPSAEYHVIGYVEFYVFGYRGGAAPFDRAPNWVPNFPWQPPAPDYACPPGDECIVGQVTTALIASTSGGGRTRSVTLTG